MPVQLLEPSTIEEIERDVAAFEQKHKMTTAKFLAEDGCVKGVDEDEAVEWLYLAEQIRALREPAFCSPYARTEPGVQLKTCADVAHRLAA